MKKRFINGYMVLLEMLEKHPDFSFYTDNVGDSEVIALGTALWKEWEENEKGLPFDETGIPETLDDCGLDRAENTDKRKIATLALEGYETKEISEKLKLPKNRVFNYMKKMGFQTGNRSRYPFSKDELIEAITELKAISKVANKFGISAQKVRGAVKLYEIKTQGLIKLQRFEVTAEELEKQYKRFGTVARTANFFNVTPQVITKNMQKYGIKKVGKVDAA